MKTRILLIGAISLSVLGMGAVLVERVGSQRAGKRVFALPELALTGNGSVKVGPIFSEGLQVTLDVTVFKADGTLFNQMGVGTSRAIDLKRRGLPTLFQKIYLLEPTDENGDYYAFIKAPSSLRKRIQLKKSIGGISGPSKVVLIYGNTNNDGAVDAEDLNFVMASQGSDVHRTG
ncbi:hypothetical protein EON80_11425 [bacterium]|nr:MAG: hypothetical protein EON80_11425 [bacterium]